MYIPVIINGTLHNFPDSTFSSTKFAGQPSVTIDISIDNSTIIDFLNHLRSNFSLFDPNEHDDLTLLYYLALVDILDCPAILPRFNTSNNILNLLNLLDELPDDLFYHIINTLKKLNITCYSILSSPNHQKIISNYFKTNKLITPNVNSFIECILYLDCFNIIDPAIEKKLTYRYSWDLDFSVNDLNALFYSLHSPIWKSCVAANIIRRTREQSFETYNSQIIKAINKHPILIEFLKLEELPDTINDYDEAIYDLFNIPYDTHDADEMKSFEPWTPKLISPKDVVTKIMTNKVGYEIKDTLFVIMVNPHHIILVINQSHHANPLVSLTILKKLNS